MDVERKEELVIVVEVVALSHEKTCSQRASSSKEDVVIFVLFGLHLPTSCLQVKQTTWDSPSLLL